MISNEALWKTYLQYVDAWQPIDTDQRAKLVAESLEGNMQYFTPNWDKGSSVKEVLADMEGFQQKFPGGAFAIESLSTHHDAALFTWVLILPDGKANVKGFDIVRFAPSGKISAITTFGPSTPKR